MAMGTRKIGPAIAAGCTMVLKPAALTPLSSLALAQILIDAGLPPGVLNVITTSKSGATTAPLIADPRLRKLSFTGSTEVGKRLIAASADQVLRVSMELGGNAPFLVFADADLDAAVDGAMLAKMRNGGEACTSANRFHVERPVAEEFAARLAERMGSLKVGRGTEEGVAVGPLIDEDQRSKVRELVDDAVAKGARVLCGGAAPSGPGYFFEPTVLSPVPDNAELLQEEIFGPVAPIVTFETEAGGGGGGQRHRIRAGRLRLHLGSGPGRPGGRGHQGRDGRPQSGSGVEPGRSVRRGQAIRVRAGRGPGGHRGVSRRQVRRPQDVLLAERLPFSAQLNRGPRQSWHGLVATAGPARSGSCSFRLEDRDRLPAFSSLVHDAQPASPR